MSRRLQACGGLWLAKRAMLSSSAVPTSFTLNVANNPASNCTIGWRLRPKSGNGKKLRNLAEAPILFSFHFCNLQETPLSFLFVRLFSGMDNKIMTKNLMQRLTPAARSLMLGAALIIGATGLAWSRLSHEDADSAKVIPLSVSVDERPIAREGKAITSFAPVVK